MEEPERGQLAFSPDDVEHGVDSQASDKFILQIGVTNLEPALFQRPGSHTGMQECPGNDFGLACIRASTANLSLSPSTSTVVACIRQVCRTRQRRALTRFYT